MKTQIQYYMDLVRKHQLDASRSNGVAHGYALAMIQRAKAAAQLLMDGGSETAALAVYRGM